MTEETPFGVIDVSIKTITTTDGEDVVGWEVSYRRNADPPDKILFALYPEEAARLGEQLSDHARSLMRPPTAH